MANPHVFNKTQTLAIQTAAKNAGFTDIWCKSLEITVHFATSGARSSFTAAIASVPNIAASDVNHPGGAYCKAIHPTA
jgi:hypothetical protein